MTSESMDFDEDRDAKIARRIEDQARATADGAAAAASDAEKALGDVITEAKDLRKKIMSGVVSPDDARRALAGLRRRHKEVAVRVPSIKIAASTRPVPRIFSTLPDPNTRDTRTRTHEARLWLRASGSGHALRTRSGR